MRIQPPYFSPRTRWSRPAGDVYGVSWDKSATSTLTRTDDAIDMVAAAGVDAGAVTNSFDSADIFRDIVDVTDSYGNAFVQIPKFYIKKTDGAGYKTWQVCRRQLPGYYLPACFMDQATGMELPFVLVGTYKANISDDGLRLESKTGKVPLINKNIVDFRNYSRANNINGLLGYQQLDIHVYDVIQTLAIIEFATLNLQSIMNGYVYGQYSATQTAAIAETAVNRIVLTNANAAGYVVGQTISLGTSQGGNQVFYGRTITAINTYDASNKEIVFDGLPVNIAIGNVLYNTGQKSGATDGVAARSGSPVSNSDGKRPCKYRGIESPWGDLFQWVDGININERQVWVANNAADFASNVFASPYEALSYINGSTDGYPTAMGFDAAHPFAAFPTAVGGGSSTYYSDYYYQTTGQRVARVGGGWINGSAAGPWYWYLDSSASGAYVSLGGRLLKKAL